MKTMLRLSAPILSLWACAPSTFDQVADDRLAPLSSQDVARFADGAAGSEVSYFSDYVSFVGKDADGFVAFAIDTNRGRSGSDYQADHFVVMHEQTRGFVEVPGSGRFPNPGRDLVRVPTSEFFRTEGNAIDGYVISSLKDDLKLTVDPLRQVTGHGDGGSVFSMRVARAVLEWQGRRIEGRAIVEYLVTDKWNKFAGSGMAGVLLRNAFGGAGFQGLYLVTGDGYDVYVQSAEGSFAGLNFPKMIGFATQGSAEDDVSRDLRFNVTDTTQGLGLYRWPVAWTASWGRTTLACREVAHKTVTNWVVGGFAMGIVQGTIEVDGVAREVYGWSEIIH